MSYLTDMRWLIILPLIPSAFFVTWVFWNLSREIWAEKRRWVRYYRATDDSVHRPKRGARTVSAQSMHRAPGLRG